jgi:hypothetical protein
MADGPEATDLSETIATAAQKPAEARGDSSSFRQHSLPDQIAADKYLAAKAGSKKKGFGLRFARIQPPGAEG